MLGPVEVSRLCPNAELLDKPVSATRCPSRSATIVRGGRPEALGPTAKSRILTAIPQFRNPPSAFPNPQSEIPSPVCHPSDKL